VRGRDWLLMAIGSYIEPIQVQKTLFKFAKESGVSKAQQYHFVPYNWGPCAKAIYPDLAELRDEGLVEFVPTGQGWSGYRLTPKGEEQGAALRRDAPSELVDELDRIRAWVVGRSFRRLLRDVYKQYRDYAKKSLFKE